jgi:hypothetical protein
VPAVGTLSSEERRGVEAASVARAGLSVSLAGVLRRVVDGRVDSQWLKDASNAQGADLAPLLRLGWIEREANGAMVPPASVGYSLGLERVSVQRHVRRGRPSIPDPARPRDLRPRASE